MAKPSISIGVDDGTGKPDNAPEGPYTTDQDDDVRKRRQQSAQRHDGPPSRAGRKDAHDERSDEDLSSRGKGPAQP
jgi:hypothetical protein